MRSHLLVIDDSCDVRRLSPGSLAPYSAILVLFWASPEALEKLRSLSSAQLMTLPKIVGGVGHWERQAAELTDRVCRSGPQIRDLAWRSYLEESLYREALTVQAALAALETCRSLAPSGQASSVRVDLMVAGDLARLLLSLEAGASRSLVSLHRLEQPGRRSVESRSFWGRARRRFQQARLTGGWKGQAANLVAQLDPTHEVRCRLSRLRQRPEIEPDGVAFFSSYLNNTRILNAFAAVTPYPVHWVITNHYSHPGALSGPGSVFRLWQFASRDIPPGRVRLDPDTPDRHPISAWLAWSPTWDYWQRHGQSSLARLTSSWENFLDSARPRLVVMASLWGIEGWLAQIARTRGTPVMQLQHGALGGYFHTQRPIEADALLVWGDFWRGLFAERDRPKIRVIHPGGAIGIAGPKRTSATPRLTYFSWPLERLRFFNQADTSDGIIEVLQKLVSSEQCELRVRFHPLENPAEFIRRWETRYGSVPEGLTLSQRGPLKPILEQTDMALMFRSTTMLDCLASDIPLVLVGWMDFGWHPVPQDLNGVHIAQSLGELHQVLRGWLQNPPTIDRATRTQFVAETPSAQVAFPGLIHELASKNGTLLRS